MKKRELIAVVITHGEHTFYYCIAEKPPGWVANKFPESRHNNNASVWSRWEHVQSIWDPGSELGGKIYRELNEIVVTTMDGETVRYANAVTARFYEKKEKESDGT